MKSFSAVSASLLAAFAISAVALPAQPELISFVKITGEKEPKDGVYSLTYAADGSPGINYAPFPNTTSTALDARTLGNLGRRDTGCDNISLDPGQTDAANAGLQNTCGAGKFGTTWVVNGDTVAFYCQYDRAAVCTIQSSQAANGYITNTCGSYWAGSYTGDGYAYGYTNWRLHDFCNIVLT